MGKRRVRGSVNALLSRSWPAALVFAGALVVYLLTLCPTVFVEGTGENIISVWSLGVPHPPGFPLFCLLGNLFASVLPIGSVAYRLNLFAAVMGAAAAAGLCVLLGGTQIGRLASVLTALTFAFSATFWRQATIAEVYTLSAVLVLVQIGLLLRWRRSVQSARAQVAIASTVPRRRGRPTQSAAPGNHPDDRPLLWFGLALGLGLTVHYTHLLLSPAYLVFVLATDRSVMRRGRTVAGTALLALAGFALHLYAPIRSAADPPMDWGNPESLSNWWQYLTAEQYRGRMFRLPVSEVLANLRSFFSDLPRELTWPGLALGSWGAAVLARRDRAFFWATALMAVIAVVWAANYDIPWEIEVYYLPAILALAIWVGVGLGAAVEMGAGRRRLRPLAALGLIVPAMALGVNFRPNDLSQERFVVDSARDALDVIEREAAVVLPATNPTFALLYLTRVEGAAPGVELWSRDERGVTPVDEAVRPPGERKLTPEARFVADALARGLGVYTIERQPGAGLAGFAQVPWGCLYRVVPASQERLWLERAPDAFRHPLRFDPGRQRFLYGAEQTLIACRYLMVEADYAWGIDDQGLADRLYQRAGSLGEGLPSVALQLGQRYVEQGRSELAVALYQRALARRDDADLRNRLGAIYGRADRLDEAEEQFARAISLRRGFGEAHANLASVYGRRGDIERAIAELEVALSCDPNSLLALRNLGFAYLQIGRREDARKLLERALEVNPAQADVRDQVERLGTDR